MKKILALLLSVMIMPIFVGCGGNDEFSANSFLTSNNTQITGLPVLSGQVGQVQLQTQLAVNQVVAQTVQVLTDTQVPSVVDEYRIYGFNSDGILIYGPVLRTKAASIVLNEVPIEVVSLRIELLTDGFIVGGVSLPVTVDAEQAFVISNPTYVFPVGATGPTGPAGPTGPTGPAGPAASTVYGGFRNNNPQTTDSEGDSVVNFPSSNSTPQGITVTSGGEVFQVSQAGDYLLTYTLVISDSGSNQSMAVRVNGGQVGSFTVNDGDGEVILNLSYTAQFVVSLSAGDQISLAQDGGIPVDIDEAFFTIVRLGDSATTAD